MKILIHGVVGFFLIVILFSLTISPVEKEKEETKQATNIEVSQLIEKGKID